jgi:hypothetical protein
MHHEGPVARFYFMVISMASVLPIIVTAEFHGPVRSLEVDLSFIQKTGPLHIIVTSASKFSWKGFSRHVQTKKMGKLYNRGPLLKRTAGFKLRRGV